MTFSGRITLLAALGVLSCLLLFVYAPVIDIRTAAYFYDGQAFPWRSYALPNLLHDLVHPVSIGLGAAFLLATVYHYVRRTGWRRWLFLFLSLVIGPGLIANTLLKDNWGRARPLQIEQFGGRAHFTPPFVMTNQCEKNCSFVGGDSSFGFWFHSLAYVAARRRRAVFVAGLGVGVLYSLIRVGMGAHFLSDVIIGGWFMLASSAVLYALMFGRKALRISWQEWLGGNRATFQCPGHHS